MAKEIFKEVARTLGDLLREVETGSIGLPDLQRPFVWTSTKVRDLLDSIMKGFPIGFIILWNSPSKYEKKKHIGLSEKDYEEPKSLIIDGQQRLTALSSAIKGEKIPYTKYEKNPIRISFNPLKREFAVCNVTYDKSPEWISEIREVFEKEENHRIPSFRNSYIKKLNEYRTKKKQEVLSEEEENYVEESIRHLLDFNKYRIYSLEINETADEEDVANIFARVNSGGQKLTETDFIETLLAVYDNDLHKKINDFCKSSRTSSKSKDTSFNFILEVKPVHLIRVAVGIAFQRARLKYAYMMLRGRDFVTEQYNEETRNANLTKFRDAMQMVTSLNDWHNFLAIIANAGYLNCSLISADNNIVYTYMFYLIGKNEYKVRVNDLRKLMTRFFFMVTIKKFFSLSYESTVESIFAELSEKKGAEGYLEYFDNLIANELTDDFFNRTLVSDLKNTSTISPSWLGYLASMNVLGYQMLFSTTTMSHFFDGSGGSKASIERHHIFPINHLAKIGKGEKHDCNQIANYAYINNAKNKVISDDAPKKYVSKWRKEHGESEYRKACKENALPLNFEDLDYDTFLVERRKLMAKLIKTAYSKLSK